MTQAGQGERGMRADLVALAAVFLVALAIRAAHVATVRTTPFFSLLVLDPALYDDWGWAIASGKSFGSGPFFQDPLYAYFLAAVYRLVGHEYLPVVTLQAMLGAAVAPLVCLAARPWLGRTAAISAGLVAALYKPAWFFDALILKTSLAVFLVALLLALLSLVTLRARHPRAWLGFAAAGAVLGLAALDRGNLLLLVPPIALWVLLDVPHRERPLRLAERAGDRRGLAAAAAFALGCLLVILPVTLRNRITGGEWVLTTGNAGQNFFIGNNPLNDTGEYQLLPFVDPNPKFEQRDFAREAARRDPRATGVGAVSRFWLDQALSWIRSDPAGWLRLMGRKLRAYWGAFEIPDNLDYYLVRERAPVLRWPGLTFGIVAPLGLLGAALLARERGWPRLLLVLVACYSASVVAFFVLARFRMAMMPALCVLAAHAALRLGGTLRDARSDAAARRRAAALVAGLVAAGAFVNLPLRTPRGSALERAARAIGIPVRAETSATGRFNLGVAYAARASEAEDPGRLLELAEHELRQAWAEESRYASVPVELGKVLARQGRDREAIEVYRAAAGIEPGDFRVQHALGLLHRRLGENEQAAESFTAALAIEPRHAPSAVQLGETLLALGRAQEAAAAFRQALAHSPGDERAAAGLQQALAPAATSR